MTTSDLVEFLTARLDEREEAAREAGLRSWFSTDNYLDDENGGDVARFEIKADARHAALHDPARVLADIAAKRQILDRLRTLQLPGFHSPSHVVIGAEGALLDVARLLALPDADHPDYREEWRPLAH